MSKRTDELFALASNPDKIPEVLTGLRDEIKAIEEAGSAAATKVAELDQRVKDLQDTNMKLFLRQTTPQGDDQEEKEETDAEKFNRLFADKILPKEDK